MTLTTIIITAAMLFSTFTIAANFQPKDPLFFHRMGYIGNFSGPLRINVVDKEFFSNLTKWYCDIQNTTFKDDEDATYHLMVESCGSVENYRSTELFDINATSMCDGLKRAVDKYQRNTTTMPRDGLWDAERLSLIMYTTNFYSLYKPDVKMGIENKYPVFNALLYKALQKLSNESKEHVVYRVLKEPNLSLVKFNGTYFFTSFSTTSADKDVATFFANDTKMGGQGHVVQIDLKNSVNLVAANVQNYSVYEGENEVLISPFCQFEVVNKDPTHLKGKEVQYFGKDYKCQ